MLPFSPVASVVPVQPLQDTVEQTLASQAGGKILEQLEPGQRVRGEVASLANGIARVRIGDALLAMRLPPVFRAGDAVELTYASRLPQPTFQVSVPGSPAVARNPAAELAAGTARTAATPVQATPARAAPARTASAQVSLTHGGAASAALAAENADLPVEPLAVQARSLAPQALSQSAAVRYRAVEQAAPPSVGLPGPDEVPKLSQAARLIGALAAEFQPGKPATLAPTMPILPRPIENPGEMAAALRSTVARSGLFYESHLVSWLQGRETTDGLMLEPQNRAAAPGFAAAQPGASPAPPATHSAPPTAATPVQAAATDAARVLLGGPDGVNPSATHAPLVAQQLQVLENPSLIWRGELWPGQRLE